VFDRAHDTREVRHWIAKRAPAAVDFAQSLHESVDFYAAATAKSAARADNIAAFSAV
jgi:hypothetical protein